MRWTHFIAGALLLSALLIGDQAGAQRATLRAHAVVIGVSGYPNVRPGLQFPDDDAEAFAGFLRTPQGGGFDVTLLTNEEATRGAIYRALNGIAPNVGDRDIVYVFFAGHSVVGSDGVAYLMPYDGDEKLPVVNGITAAGFLRQVAELYGRASRVVVFVDACNSGAVMDPEGVAARGGEDINQALTTVWTRESALMNANEQRLVMGFFSAQARQLSYEHPLLGHGLFTHYLLRGLGGEADGFSPNSPEKDGIVRAYELRDFLQSNVSRHSRVLFNQVQDPVASPIFDRDFAMSTSSPGGRHRWVVPTSPVSRNQVSAQPAARRAPVDGEFVLRTGETTPVGDLQTFFGVWHAGGRHLSARLNGEEGSLEPGESFEFTHSGGACRVRFLSTADPDPDVEEDELHRFSLVCRPRGATRWPPPSRRQNSSWEPDFWLRVAQTTSLTDGRTFFGVLNWGVGINVWRTSIDVSLNGERHKLWAGDRLEVPGGAGKCFISYVRTEDPDIRIEGDEHHGFTVLCDGGEIRMAGQGPLAKPDLQLRTGQTVRIGDGQHFFGVRHWGWGINIDQTSILVALDDREHRLRAGARLQLTHSRGQCFISYMGTEDPNPERQGDERHGFAVACDP
ncbi:caspase family protein [Longimicrobium terrae]|uniref:Peptidase C14 caspase domain-containing protein n=1 Tax=Longimicrobium terrae TaxID=1639882 RepID=A0A841GNK9_9BACT|nr:caspase family protein [Longimicrobium terrae]MBB4636015.1 hypothetical protein [Longimicrobium terrae]MBB6070411.1 hypothetical protein [Longimicrobium terrae]NNC30905.1 caspase family protein [Longimicrobium terrae]